jgi:hypothetical protein
MVDMDSVHAGILLVGMWLAIELALAVTTWLPGLLLAVTVWVVGYYGFIQALPERWSGQEAARPR